MDLQLVSSLERDPLLKDRLLRLRTVPHGVQVDRSGQVFLGGVNIYFGTTAALCDLASSG